MRPTSTISRWNSEISSDAIQVARMRVPLVIENSTATRTCAPCESAAVGSWTGRSGSVGTLTTEEYAIVVGGVVVVCSRLLTVNDCSRLRFAGGREGSGDCCGVAVASAFVVAVVGVTTAAARRTRSRASGGMRRHPR